MLYRKRELVPAKKRKDGPFSPRFFRRKDIAAWRESMYKSYFTISLNKYCDFSSQLLCALIALADRGEY